jgi:hypothetical protein
MAGRGWRGTLGLLLVVGALLGAAHATAPGVRAECDGGLLFSATAPLARAAVVGRVTAVSQSESWFKYVTAVRVERAYGVSPGPVYRGRVLPGGCGDDPRVGSRVVLLLGVDLPGKALDGDHYFIVGQSVTAAQAASVGTFLPDTDAAATLAVPAPTWPPALAFGSGVLAFSLAWRRLSRAAAPPPTPRPRTPAA